MCLLGIYLGGGLASLSIILDGNIGWRNTLLVIGGFGFVALGACLAFIKEPRLLSSSSANQIAVRSPQAEERKKTTSGATGKSYLM